MKYAHKLWLLQMFLAIGGGFCDVDVPTIETKYTYLCPKLDETLFEPKPLHPEKDVPIVIETEEDDALQQTVSRIYAIVLRQVFGFTNVTMMQTINIPDATMTADQRVDKQLQAFVNKVMSCAFCVVFNLGIQLPVAYPQVDHLVNAIYAGPLGPNSRYVWFLPNRTRGRDPLPERQLHINTFDAANFGRVAKYFHVRLDKLLVELNVDAANAVHFAPTYCTVQKPCAIMLAGNAAETAFISEHIRALDVRVQVLWLGDQLLRHVTKLRQGTDPPLFLLLARTPSEIVRSPGDYRSVMVPTYGDRLSPMQAGVYDLTPLTKYSNMGVLYPYISKLHFDGEEDWLLGQVADRILMQPNVSRTAIYEEVACDWLNNTNQLHRYLLSIDTWVFNTTALIGGIFPTGPMFGGLQVAAEMAVQAINESPQLLSGMELILTVAHPKESPLKSFIKMSMEEEMVGVIGPDIKEITFIAEPTRTPIILYTSDGGNIVSENSINDPYCFRTIGDRQQFVAVYDALFRAFGWKRIAMLSDYNDTHTQYHLQLAANLRNSSYDIETLQFRRNFNETQIRTVLGTLQSNNMRIIIAELSSFVADRVLCEAYRLGMTAHQDYAWFLPSELVVLSKANRTGPDAARCSASQMREAYDGHLSLYAAPFAKDTAALRPDAKWATVADWRRDYRNGMAPDDTNRSLDAVGADWPSYAGFVYDAVWVYALALNHTISISEQQNYKLGSENTTALLRAAMANSDMPHGVSGHVRFTGVRSSRVSDIYVGQRRGSGPTSKWSVVYMFLANQTVGDGVAGSLVRVLHSDLRLWPNTDEIISDGSPVCPLRPLNEWLHLGCGSTITFVCVFFAVVGMCSILGSMYVFWERRYRSRLEKEAQMLRSFGIDLVSRQVDQTRLDTSEIARNRIVLNRRLGGGQFGTVYFGQLRNDQDRYEQVAIKTPENPNNYNLRLEFLSEAQAMRHFDHPNIVRLIGVSLLVDPMYIVMEYMVLGDLNIYLLSRRQQVTADTRAQWSRLLTGIVLDLARGLAYMAECRYVHRDIACRNCLLTGAGEHVTAKLADFGMTRPVFADDVYRFCRRGALPLRWSAPESMLHGIYSHASDVWSFGVLMWEIVMLGSYPFHEVHDDQVLLSMIRNGRTLTIPPEVNEDLRWLITECWHLEAKMRMRACAIVDFIGGRPTVVEPKVMDDSGDEFAQIYEMNNEPGKKVKCHSPDKPTSSESVGSDLASVQTLHNDLSPDRARGMIGAVAGGPERMSINHNYAGGVQPLDAAIADAGENKAANRQRLEADRPGGAAQRPLLERRHIIGRPADWSWPNWPIELRFWRYWGRRRRRRPRSMVVDEVEL